MKEYLTQRYGMCAHVPCECILKRRLETQHICVNWRSFNAASWNELIGRMTEIREKLEAQPKRK
jgi:hypothetical protein